MVGRVVYRVLRFMHRLMGTIIRVTIKNTNYEYSKYLFNRLKALEVDIELNQTRYAHTR